MMRTGLPRKLLLKLVASVACAFTVTVAITWTVHAVLAERNAMKVINRVLDDVQWEIEDRVNRKLVLAAMTVRDRLSETPDRSAKTLRSIADELRVDDVCVVDANGVLVASADPAEVGLDFNKADGQAKAFLVLLNAESEFCQPLRPCSHDGTLRKYVGVWLPEGGFVQVGCRESTLRVFARSEVIGLTRNRHVAGTDSILVTTEKGHILSCAKESGLEGSVIQEPGDDVYAVKRVIEGFDVYAILPKTTAALERNTLVGSSAVMTILALVFVAVLVGIAISRFVREQVEKRIQADMAMAKAIQANVLPSTFPPYPALADRIDLFARMITAKEVGGDFYDFYFVGPGRLALVIADVSGKGVPAALFMMRAKATLQGYLKGGTGLAEAVASANDRLSENNDANMFVTAWVGVVDIATGETEYVNAGHNPPLVKRADGSVEFLVGKSGPPLAAMGGVLYCKKKLRLGVDDGLVLYTDGVTEAVNPAMELYGESRLRETVTGLLGARDAQAMLSGIVDSVGRFAGGAEQADDITLLAFKRKAKGEELK